MSEDQLIEIIRLAYLAGGNDEQEGGHYWCRQGSKEKAEELLEEFKSDTDFSDINFKQLTKP